MSDMRPPPLQHHRRVARACVGAGSLVVAITLAMAVLLASSYDGTVEREQTNLRNLATAYAARTRYATLAMDMALARDAERALRGESGTISALAGAVREDMPFRVYVLAQDGRLMAKHPLAMPDKPPPRPGQASVGVPEIGLGAPDRPGAPPTITLSRTLPGSAGRTGGSIVIETDAAYFEHILDAADLGKTGTISLVRSDGTILTLKPGAPNTIGRSVAQSPMFQVYLRHRDTGVLDGRSPLDGSRRLYGYAMVPDYPLVVVIARDKDEALDLWYDWLWVAVASWLLLSCTLMVLALRIGREASRQAALIDRLTVSESRLQHSYGYLMRIVDALPTPLWVLDAQRRIVLFNEAFRRFVGRAGTDGLAGREDAEAFDPAGAPARAHLYASVADGAVHTLEAEVRDGVGETRTVIQMAARLESEDQAPQIVNSFTDITERKRAELRLAYLADYDTLTGLPNNDRFRRVLEEAVRDAAARGAPLALLLVTLERLQEVADLLGHDAGDEAVIQVAARLGALDGTLDGALNGALDGAPLCTARVKANEFALVVPVPAAHGAVDAFAFELHRLLSEPVRVRGREFYLAPVIGIALYPQDAAAVNELMRLADIAKHRARGEGGEPVHFHSASTHVRLNERLSIEEKLRRALERGELSAVYQPKVGIASGRVTGVEALLRWDNPDLGSVGPARFIPIAEQTGLIVPIGHWILRTACRHASAWQREHGIRTRVAVNLSIRQLYQRDLLRAIGDALADSGLPPACLELEITESIAMSRIDVVERRLAGIRDLGVELSIDDFGTGYSSLAYLKRFPVQCLKVDRAFVRDLGRDADSAAIVRSIVALGHGLQMRIVAEGVETEGQLAMLRELGCDEYQGFLFARPVAAAAVPALLGGNALHNLLV